MLKAVRQERGIQDRNDGDGQKVRKEGKDRMKLTKGKKIALTCFAAFLGFMAVCTVAAKGIYASGLPQVSTARPYSGSLTHVIKVSGTVMQGQEYGVYVEPGLRVDTISVGKGDTFQKDAPLFRIAPGDLADIIAQRRLEISKLEVQLSEEIKEESRERKDRQQAAERAWEDYDREGVLADAKIQECRQAYEAAQRALVLYNQYLENASRPAESGEASAPTEDSGTGTIPPEESRTESTPSGEGEGESALSEESGTESSSPGETGTDPESGAGAADPSREADVVPDTDSSVENGTESSVPGETGTDPESGAGAADPSRETDVVPDTESSVDNKTESRQARDGRMDYGGQPEGTGTEQNESGGENAGGNAAESGKGMLHEVADAAADPEDQYNKEEKRRQLEQNVIAAAQALAEAERQKEDRLQTAARAAEDAEAAIEAANAAVNTLALEITYQKESLQSLEELLAADGWVYAQAPGRVTDSRLEVGERTQDRACLLYALDEGERIISAVLDEDQAERVSSGTQFDMKAAMSDGSRITGTAQVDYVEKGADGMFYARLSFDRPEISIGQTVELSCRMQTENYTVCVPVNCIYTEDIMGAFYVYIAEERQGILGTEWKVRKVFVRILDQNDTAAAIQSMELTAESRIVTGANKPLADGDTVRIVL